MQKRNRWTEAEKEFIREAAAVMLDEEILDVLLRTSSRKNLRLSSIQSIRRELGIHKERGRGRCEIRVDNDEPIAE